MNWLRNLGRHIADRIEHKPKNCAQCRAILTVLEDQGPLLGHEMVEAKPDSIKRGLVYVHLGQLEDRGLVERCWTEKVGPAEPFVMVPLKRYVYRLTAQSWSPGGAP